VSFEQPAFLTGGIFEWNALGYQFPTAPSMDLRDPTALRDENPWIVLGAVLERAKSGDAQFLPNLVDCIRRSDSWVLSRDCALLLGDAGWSALLKKLPIELRDFDRGNICYSLSGSGLLWTVPVMLDLYLENPTHDSIIPILISKLLEKGYGPVSLGERPDHAYRDFVMQKYEELVKKFGGSEVPVLFGEVFSVRKLATLLIENLSADEIQPMIVRYLRHRFEAATGIDCSDFFREYRLQLLTARAMVEDFLAGPYVGMYEEGVRYFFGHRIPN
jgi:hypothetical protein